MQLKTVDEVAHGSNGKRISRILTEDRADIRAVLREVSDKLNLRLNQITDGTGITPIQRGGTSHGNYQAHGEVVGLKMAIHALEPLIDTLLPGDVSK